MRTTKRFGTKEMSSASVNSFLCEREGAKLKHGMVSALDLLQKICLDISQDDLGEGVGGQKLDQAPVEAEQGL